MSQSISKRLESIRYQILRHLIGSFSDVELVEKARGILDAAIKSSNAADFESVVLPTTIFKTVQLSWGESNTSVSITQGTAAVIDTLIDEVVPTVEGDTSNYLETNSELFTVNGEYLLVA